MSGKDETLTKEPRILLAVVYVDPRASTSTVVSNAPLHHATHSDMATKLFTFLTYYTIHFCVWWSYALLVPTAHVAPSQSMPVPPQPRDL